jgi:glycosyltransferase involved in cell wall biosynthesis
MWRGQTVALILPTYNEKDSIREVIEGFLATGVLDEIIAVNNNAAAGTSEEISLTPAREVHEREQGYGAAIQRGLRETAADLVVICEPDGTFAPRDVFKLLAYSEDFPVVLGTRTAREFIWEGANMGIFLKWGNYAVAKLLELLFNTVNLTDVGCTFRLLRRDAILKMTPHFTVSGSHFGPEMMLLACVLDIPLVQVPVNYRARVGISSVTGSTWKAFALGIRMITLVLSYKWRFQGLRIPRRRALR